MDLEDDDFENASFESASFKDASFKDDRDAVQQALLAGDLAHANELLVAMHIKYHAFARQHVQVHVLFMQLNRMKGQFFKVLGHCFAGYVFAVPASLIQSKLGLVVPAFKEKQTRR